MSVGFHQPCHAQQLYLLPRFWAAGELQRPCRQRSTKVPERMIAIVPNSVHFFMLQNIILWRRSGSRNLSALRIPAGRLAFIYPVGYITWRFRTKCVRACIPGKNSILLLRLLAYSSPSILLPRHPEGEALPPLRL